MHVRVATEDPSVDLRILGEILLKNGVPPESIPETPGSDPSECGAVPGEDAGAHLLRISGVMERLATAVGEGGLGNGGTGTGQGGVADLAGGASA